MVIKELLFEKDGTTPQLYKKGTQKIETIKCRPDDPAADHTANGSLIFYHGKVREDLGYFTSLGVEGKALSKVGDEWKVDVDGCVFLAYQTKDGGYHGRSFEDAFFSINKALLGTDHEKFPSLTPKWFNKYVKGECDAFEFAEKAVGKKPSLAIEILLNSIPDKKSDFSNWKTPHYIQEGLEWLRK